MICMRLLLTALLSAPSITSATSTSLSRCTRSATLLACHNANGSFYSIQTAGEDLFLRGFDSATGRRWAQTNSRYGSLSFYIGLASDGEVWFGYSRRIGWTTVNRVSSSSGQRFDLHCSLVGGCR
nr:glutamine synthetase [Pseudomonas sp.]